jgi:AcrR family transcriptional regulator
MSRPTKHDANRILDAARDLVLQDGARAASIGAIAQASAAPVGTLYNRFASREALLAEMWFRALARFQASYLQESSRTAGDPVEAGVAMAVSIVRFARTHAADARLLLSLRPEDVFDADPGHEERLQTMNAPLRKAVQRLARKLHGRAGPREVGRVMLAVIDLPYGAVRRYARSDGEMPAWLEEEVADISRALLTRRASSAEPRSG